MCFIHGLRMAHQAVKCSQPSPNRHCYWNTASCKSVYQHFLLGTARMTAHLCPDRTMENVELVQSCTEPTRLCECKLVTECSPEYSQPRTANRALLTAHWEKAHRTGQRTLRFPKLAIIPAPPHGDRFPQAFLYVVPLLNPMRLSVYSDQDLSRKLFALWTVNTKSSTHA